MRFHVTRVFNPCWGRSIEETLGFGQLVFERFHARVGNPCHGGNKGLYIHSCAMYDSSVMAKLGKDLVAASAAPLVLSILAEGESYGYAIIQRVRELSGGQMQWTDGMLYPVLHRLETQGAITSK